MNLNHFEIEGTEGAELARLVQQVPNSVPQWLAGKNGPSIGRFLLQEVQVYLFSTIINVNVFGFKNKCQLCFEILRPK